MRILRQLGILRDWLLIEEIAQAGAKFLPGRLPIDTEVLRSVWGCYLPASCCTIANDFFTCSSGARLSSFDENVAMIL